MPKRNKALEVVYDWKEGKIDTYTVNKPCRNVYGVHKVLDFIVHDSAGFALVLLENGVVKHVNLHNSENYDVYIPKKKK